VRVEIVGDADSMAEDRGLNVTVVIDIDSADELNQLACLGAKVRPLGVNHLSYEVDGHRIIAHLRCALISRPT
jgi:hypothetical protein